MTTHKHYGLHEGFLLWPVWLERWLPALQNLETSQVVWWQEIVLYRRTICVEAAEDLLGQHKTFLSQRTSPQHFPIHLRHNFWILDLILLSCSVNIVLGFNVLYVSLKNIHVFANPNTAKLKIDTLTYKFKLSWTKFLIENILHLWCDINIVFCFYLQYLKEFRNTICTLQTNLKSEAVQKFTF